MSIDSIVSKFMKDNNTPGVMVSVQKNGATTFAKGYGVIETGGSVPDASNSFQIDSLTKAFTAFAVLRLWEQGTIANLTDTLGQYVTGLPNKAWGTVQIEQLLAMVSGIPDSGSATATYKQSLQSIAGKALRFTPGSKYDYSNSNYFLLGELVDAIGGGYETYTTKNVLDVFVMANTGLIDQGAAKNPVTPYENGKAVSWRNPSCGYSAGGFASTMTDLESFAIGLSNGLVLEASTYQTMWTNYTLTDGKPGEFGLGWQVVTRKDGSVQQVQKDGGGYGWGSVVIYAPPASGGGLTGGNSVCVLLNNDAHAATLGKEILSSIE